MYRNIFLVGGWTIASRLTGFLRDIALAALMGGGALNDAYVAAIKLPNQFRQIFGEGSFNAAYLPTYTRVLEADGPEEAGRFASQVFTLLILSQIALLGLVYLDMPLLVRLTSPGFIEPAREVRACGRDVAHHVPLYRLHCGVRAASGHAQRQQCLGRASFRARRGQCLHDRVSWLRRAFSKSLAGGGEHGELGISRLRRDATRHRHGRRAPARAPGAADLAALDARDQAVLLDAGAGDRHFGELPDRRARRPDCRLAPADRRPLRHQLRRPALSIAGRRHHHRHRLGAAEGNVRPRRSRR